MTNSVIRDNGYDNSMIESSQKQESDIIGADNYQEMEMKKTSMFKKHIIQNVGYCKLTQLDVTNLDTFQRQFSLMGDKEYDKGGGLNNFIELFSKNTISNKSQNSFNNLYMYQIPKESSIILSTAQSQIEVQFEIKKENTGQITEFKRESIQFKIDLLESFNNFNFDQQQFMFQKYKNGQVEVLYNLKINPNDKIKIMKQLKSQQQVDFKEFGIQISDFCLIIENKNNSYKKKNNLSSETTIQSNTNSIEVKKERIQLQQKFQQELRDLQKRNVQKVNEDIADQQQRKAAFSFQAQRAFSVAASLNAKSLLALKELQLQSKEGKYEGLKTNIIKPNLEYLKTRRMSTFANLTGQNLLEDNSISSNQDEAQQVENQKDLISLDQDQDKLKEKQEFISQTISPPVQTQIETKQDFQQATLYINREEACYQEPIMSQLLTEKIQQNKTSFVPPAVIQQAQPQFKPHFTGQVPPIIMQNQSSFNQNYQIHQPIQEYQQQPLDQYSCGAPISNSGASVFEANQPQNNAQRIMMQITDPKEVIARILNKQGSKDFQKALTVTNSMSQAIKLEIENLVEFLVQKILEANDFQSLLIHQYGNYFCQKLFPRLKFDQKLKLLKELEKTKSDEQKPQIDQIPKEYYTRVNQFNSNFLWVAMNPKGTHSLQVFIENLEEDEFKQIITSIIQKENPLFFAFNKHATHVLIKFIELTTEVPHLQAIFQVLTNNVQILSMDVNGLPLVKKLLAWIRTPNYKQNMINELSKNAIQLSQNAYGNYSLQVAFDNWQVSECKQIFYNLQLDLQKLSVQKFSSNVIEKIIDSQDQETIIAYSKELNKPETLKTLMKNQFGFYVLERILLNCNDEQVVLSMTTEIRKALNQLLGNLDMQVATGEQSPNYSTTNTSIQIRQKWHDLLDKIQRKESLGISPQQLNVGQPQFYPNQAMQQQPEPQPYYGNMPNYKHMIPHQQVGPSIRYQNYRGGGYNQNHNNQVGIKGEYGGGYTGGGGKQYYQNQNQNYYGQGLANTSKPFNPNQKSYHDKSNNY